VYKRQKYYSVNPADNTSLKKFLMESGADEGDDISFDFEFNGTDKVRINGKSKEEMEALFEKHFPKNPAEIPAKPEALPIEKTPTVEKRKL
jgi:hypothetical protein